MNYSQHNILNDCQCLTNIVIKTLFTDILLNEETTISQFKMSFIQNKINKY
jgi:hypothetical protein